MPWGVVYVGDVIVFTVKKIRTCRVLMMLLLTLMDALACLELVFLTTVYFQKWATFRQDDEYLEKWTYLLTR
jgi:hypothetical protein